MEDFYLNLRYNVIKKGKEICELLILNQIF